MNTRILLVEDHPLMCAGLRLLFEREADLAVVGEAHDGRAALAVFRELAPHIVILDIGLAGTDGLSIAAEMLAESPQSGIIIYSALLDPGLVDRALRIGVRGYLVKANAEGELLQAVRAVQAGKAYLCADVAQIALANYRKLPTAAAGPARPLVTERELDVLRLTAEGLRVKEIATRLNIGVKTVDTHRSNLFAKLGCSSAADLTRYAIREGIILP
jgi:DNA-binding NarL/FixJ family response regulator